MSGWKLGLAAVAALGLAGPAFAADASRPEWIWSNTASAVNRATEALATGHPARAARFAQEALAANLDPVDGRIAAHNLCLARIAHGALPQDEAACAAAARGADHPLVRRRGALVPGEDGTISLTGMIAANIAIAAQHAMLTHTAAAE